jgi:hypothetical protein
MTTLTYGDRIELGSAPGTVWEVRDARSPQEAGASRETRARLVPVLVDGEPASYVTEVQIGRAKRHGVQVELVAQRGDSEEIARWVTGIDIVRAVWNEQMADTERLLDAFASANASPRHSGSASFRGSASTKSGAVPGGRPPTPRPRAPQCRRVLLSLFVSGWRAEEEDE